MPVIREIPFPVKFRMLVFTLILAISVIPVTGCAGSSDEDELAGNQPGSGRSAQDIPTYSIDIPASIDPVSMGAARYLFENEYYEDTLIACDHVLLNNRDNPFAWMTRADSLMQLGRHQEALESYSHAAQLNPNDPAAVVGRGNAFREMGRIKDSIIEYENALGLDDEYADAYAKRAFAYEENGDFELAIADHDRAIELDPDNPHFLMDRAFTYLDHDYYDSALTDFNRAIELLDSDPVILAGRAETHFRLGNYMEALDDCGNALYYDTSFVQAYLIRGLTYIELNETEFAASDLSRVLTLDPDNESARTALDEITSG